VDENGAAIFARRPATGLLDRVSVQQAGSSLFRTSIAPRILRWAWRETRPRLPGRQRLPRRPTCSARFRLLSQFGTKLTQAAAGSAQSLYLVVSDIVVARSGDVSQVLHPFQPNGSSARPVAGPFGRSFDQPFIRRLSSKPTPHELNPTQEV
jgi:hypothetical protein